MTSDTARTEEATDLLQHLIRNRCVNDGTAASGHEQRSADVLVAYLEGSGADLETYEPAPGRTSLVAKLHGPRPVRPVADPARAHRRGAGQPRRLDATTLSAVSCIDGEMWGRGAIDMLNLTATMATSFREVAHSGFRPAGDLTYVAVADEEALGTYGAGWLCQHVADEVNADYVITESGRVPHGRGRRHPPPAR